MPRTAPALGRSVEEYAVVSVTSYDRQAHAHHWHPEALFGLVYEYLRPGDHLLDAGIGTGLASQTFAKAGVQVFGFDTDQDLHLYRQGAACRAQRRKRTRVAT